LGQGRRGVVAKPRPTVWFGRSAIIVNESLMLTKEVRIFCSLAPLVFITSGKPISCKERGFESFPFPFREEGAGELGFSLTL
jgi:hypothetical protein